ncbi:hypothetical protein RG116_003716, partial [Acinetobacter baumannii]
FLEVEYQKDGHWLITSYENKAKGGRMNFIEKSQLINVIVQEIVEAIIPVNWNYIYFYTERLRDKEIGLRKNNC